MKKKDYPRKVLLLSDTHIGSSASNFAEYQRNVIELMTHYDDVAMIGDCWELFYVGDKHVRALSHLLEVVSDKDVHHWKKKFDGEGTTRSGVENVINGATWFTSEFLERFPDTHLHFVAGNHESVRRFHNEFEALQEKYPNFEWSPQAIRIGDALITHAHLPMRGKPFDEDSLARLRDAEKDKKWGGFAHFFAPMEHKVQKLKGKERSAALIEAQLAAWSGTNKFMVSHNREHEPLDMSWVKHVFYGHTHIKFDNYKREEGELLFHNTGAFVESASPRPEDMGILEAKLNADGTITDVKPVSILKDRKIFLVGNTATGTLGR